MRGLFTKIFLGFWIAQSLTFILSTMLILQHRYAGPDRLFDSLRSTLEGQASAAADVYEKQGCEGLKPYAASLRQDLQFADSSGSMLCDPHRSRIDPAAASQLDREPGALVLGEQPGSHYSWTIRVRSKTGRYYLCRLLRPYPPNRLGWWHDLGHVAFPQLAVAIVVCGATTFVLVLLLTRPIARLRVAARNLAQGRLEARVSSRQSKAGIFGSDEIQGLVHDFNYMAERLESLVGAQKMLLRDVSHELRSPLARLSVALELAREEAPHAMTDHLQRIEREAERLNLLIGQLLRLSSMESTEAPLGQERFSLLALVQEILPDAMFEAQQRSRHVQLHSLCDCSVQGSSELIYRAVENIVRNAIRYTEQDSIVEIALSCESREGAHMARIEVSDRGPGVPENELEDIFRPFYRSDWARQRDTGGFGVGLAIAERAIRLHRGTVSAHNRSGGESPSWFCSPASHRQPLVV